MRLFSLAVRGRGGLASEPRQALIGATVVCPCLPRFPGGTFFRHLGAPRLRPAGFTVKANRPFPFLTILVLAVTRIVKAEFRLRLMFDLKAKFMIDLDHPCFDI